MVLKDGCGAKLSAENERFFLNCSKIVRHLVVVSVWSKWSRVASEPLEQVMKKKVSVKKLIAPRSLKRKS